jgi:acetyltransferase-like isoleucine patch superfamily enzyme
MHRVFFAISFRFNRILAGARAAFAGLTGAKIGRRVHFARDVEARLGSTPESRGAICLGDRTRLDRGVVLRPYGGRIETGIDVYVGPYTVIYGHGGVSIGKDTLISMHCRILSSDHAMPPPGTIIRSVADVRKPTRIGADVWLGAGVTVLGGVTIGDGCVVGAGAVVTNDLPPYSIAVGVPAVLRGHRK